MPRLLVVHHTPSPALHSLLTAVLDGVADPALADVEVVTRPALVASAADVLEADGVVVGGPVNLGNPVENTVRELALLVGELTGVDVTLTQEALPEDDPRRRLPDIGRAISVLNWEPRISLRDGLVETIAYFRNRI